MIYYLILVNSIAFFYCYLDKRKAIQRNRRIKEKVLFQLIIIGGGLGFLIAMYTFHHKTKHLKFVIITPLFTIIWMIILLIERGII